MANHLGQAVRLPDYMADASLSYFADIFRNVIDHFGTAGRRDSQSLVVKPYSGGGMRIQVGPGTALVVGTDRGGADASGITLQGSYIARVDATIGPISVAAAPSTGTRTDNVYLVVSDKAENGSGTNDAYVLVQDSTVTRPPSALILATIAVAHGTGAITNAMITPGGMSRNPALADPNYGYVDRQSIDNDPDDPIAGKRFDKIAIGSAPLMGANVLAQTIAANFTLPNKAWTDIPFSNANPGAGGINYGDGGVQLHDDGQTYQNPSGPLNGWVPNATGWYRISAAFTFNPGGGANIGRRGIRAIVEGGRVIVTGIADAGEIADDHPLCISMPFYWNQVNATSNPIKVQLWQGSGHSMQIIAPDGQHPQIAIFERLPW